MRALATTLTIIVAFAAAGVAAAQTPEDAPLSDARAAAIEPVLEAAVVLDAIHPPAARLQRFASRCRRLPQSTDALLAAFRSSCRNEGDAYTADLRLPTCKSTVRCRARLQRYAASLGRQGRSARRFNAALDNAVTDHDCRAALRVTYAALRTVARLQSAAKALERAITRGSTRALATGLRRFYAIDRSALFDHRGRLDTFRATCR